MKRIRRVLMFLVLWVPAAEAAPELYSNQQLAAEQERYAQNFNSCSRRPPSLYVARGTP